MNALNAVRRKPIKKGRFAGKYKDMTYAVDYTNDRWHASKYGKDGMNVTEITITGPYVTDADGRERRHILYKWASGREYYNVRNPDVEACVREIMRGPNVVRQGDEAFAWNAADYSRKGIVENADFGDPTRKVKVVADTDTLFGKRRETKVMSLGELRDNMTKAGHGGVFAKVLRDLEAGREANPYTPLPCEAWFSWA